ncbi:MAG: hypothetical protein AAF722_15230 [Cyanobacteria bacterium P01_C01_bin.70]
MSPKLAETKMSQAIAPYSIEILGGPTGRHWLGTVASIAAIAALSRIDCA